jgi:GntR family transcriptional repressor for pyruvate dehydrogenase complex
VVTGSAKGPAFGRRTLLDDLTAALITLIQDGGYSVGDRLPAMPALATQFGVATPTLREAARRLEAAGTIAFRHGSGIYVTGDPRRLVIPNPARDKLGDGATFDVLDTRLLIEPELAGRAARHCSSEELDQLKAILDQVVPAIEEMDEPSITHLNMSFHVEIARAAGNQILTEALQSVVELYEPQQVTIGRIYDDAQRDHAEHRAIFAAIAAKDSARAEGLMRSHLEEIIGVLKDRLGWDQSTNAVHGVTTSTSQSPSL